MATVQPPRQGMTGAERGADFRAKQQRGLGNDLGLESASRDDRNFLQPGVRRQAGTRVDQVMRAAPPSAPDAARGRSLVAQQQGDARDAYRPSMAARTSAGGAQVATEIDH